MGEASTQEQQEYSRRKNEVFRSAVAIEVLQFWNNDVPEQYEDTVT